MGSRHTSSSASKGAFLGISVTSLTLPPIYRLAADQRRGAFVRCTRMLGNSLRHQASDGQRASRKANAAVTSDRQSSPKPYSQLIPMDGVQRCHVAWSRSSSAKERLPVVVEG